MILRTFAVYALLLIANHLFSQSIGVRAGWNLNKFTGPLELSEKYSNTNGIHFGFNYGYLINKQLSFRGELTYSQSGTRHQFDTTSFYLIYLDTKTIVEKGKRNMDLQISNSYVGLPLSVVWQPLKKFEFFAGLNPQILISPTGRGTLRFKSTDRPSEIVFKQSLDYRYYKDQPKAKSQDFFNNSVVRIIVDNDVITLPKAVGAYYQADALIGSRFNWFNLSAFGGFNYFLNKGFYVGLRYERGLLDLTNKQMDFSMIELNENLSLKKRDDKDFQITTQISLGFKF